MPQVVYTPDTYPSRISSASQTDFQTAENRQNGRFWPPGAHEIPLSRLYSRYNSDAGLQPRGLLLSRGHRRRLSCWPIPRTGPASSWTGSRRGKATAALATGKHHDAVGRVPVVATAGGDPETAGDSSVHGCNRVESLRGIAGAKHWSGAQRRGWAVAQSRGGATEGGAEDAIEVASAEGEARARKGPGGTEASRHFSSAQSSGVSG